MITYISHTLAQQIVNTIKDVCSYDINFINPSGTIIASTNSARIGTFHEIGRKAAATGTTIEVAESDNFTGTRQGINMPLYHEDNLLAVIGITGSPEKVRKYAFLAQRITSLLIREQELSQYSQHQADKKHFVISSLLHGDAQNPEYLLKCLREFQIDPDTPKRLILIRTYSGSRQISQKSPQKNTSEYTDSSEFFSTYTASDAAHSTQIHSAENTASAPKTNTDFSLPEHHIRNLFTDTGITLYTFRYPGDYLAVADNSRFSEISGKLRRFAGKHGDTLSIAVGKSVPLHQLNLSLTTAETALRSLQTLSAGNDSDKSITEHYVLFDDLTLEIVLSSVSPEDREAFAEKTIRRLSDNEKELLRTYFSLEMSLADTAEKLFLHKNTLQYKLNHIYKKCGLNPRKFRDAVLLYLALEME